MIITEAPKLDDDLKIVTPWWDVTAKYIIAAMVAIAFTCIAVQMSKDNLICLPVIDCSRAIAQNHSAAVNVSEDILKICRSLTPKRSKKQVLINMADRRSYDYVDSMCFQELSWLIRFFPFILFGETMLLLVCDLLWTKLPFTSSVLNHFVDLANEANKSYGTLDNILTLNISHNDTTESTESHIQSANVTNPAGGTRSEGIPLVPSDQEHAKNKRQSKVPDADAFKIQTLVENARIFRDKYITSNKTCCVNKCCSFLFCFYIIRAVIQVSLCITGIIYVSYIFEDQEIFFSDIMHFKCTIDEYVFHKEYDHFDCAYPLAPYFKVAAILFLILLILYFLISWSAIFISLKYGRSYTFPDKKTVDKKDFAFLFFLLKQHNELYADRVSYFFKAETKDNLSTYIGNISNYMEKEGSGG